MGYAAQLLCEYRLMAVPDDHCPQCAGRLTSVRNGPVWCVDCEWNLGAMQPALHGKTRRFDRASHRVAYALNQRLAAHLAAAPPSRPGWTAAKVALAVASLGFVVAWLAGLVYGVYLVANAEVPGKLLGILLIGIGIEVRPRVPRLRSDFGAVSRSDAPELYGLVDDICARLGAPHIERILLDDAMNASCGRSGLRRTPVLVIGLPLWSALTPAARLALLGHEVGHLVNGDPNRGLLTEPAMTTLARLAMLVNPRHFTAPANRGFTGYELIANAIALVVLTPVERLLRWTQMGLWMIAARDHQRAEIFADALAVTLAGTAGATELMRVLVTFDSVQTAVARSARQGESPEMWHQRAQLSLRDLESRERVQEQFSIRVGSSMFSSHPPSGIRLRLVRAWPSTEPQHDAAPAQFAEVDSQLASHYRRVGRALATR